MKAATKKMRSPLKWHGGKSYLARRIVAMMPDHDTYVEPFAGGLSVLLNKPKSRREVAGDLNECLIKFWSAMRFWSDDIKKILDAIDYTEDSFKQAVSFIGHDLLMDCYFLVRNRFSRGGLGKDFAWSDRLRGGKPGDVNAWDTIRAELPAIAERIKDVLFHHADALKVIESYDRPETLFYLDPPYLHETRTAKKAYAHEMSVDDHADLLALALDCRGAVMISGYWSKLYSQKLEDWHLARFDMPNHSGQGKSKQRRIECIWSNRPFPGV